MPMSREATTSIISVWAVQEIFEPAAFAGLRLKTISFAIMAVAGRQAWARAFHDLGGRTANRQRGQATLKCAPE